MIINLFGQPCSGKTTLALLLAEKLRLHNNVIHIDGDDLRNVFRNNDYSREGRMKNLNRASDFSIICDNKNFVVVTSLMYPFAEARKYQNDLCRSSRWIYLEYDSATDVRGREQFHLQDFEKPTAEEVISGKYLQINTSTTTTLGAINIIKQTLFL